MNDHWNSSNYCQFINLRTRPAHDLLSMMPTSFQPKVVYDLGCGPGNSTILLREKWPKAQLIGIDSSSNMLKTATSKYPEITFIQQQIEDFSPYEKVDCIFANASFQWIDNHEYQIPRILQYLNTNGVFAIQMPNNFHSPTHQVTIQILQEHLQWNQYLKTLRYTRLQKPMYTFSYYYDLLVKAGINSPTLWETEYYHELPDYQSIFDWGKGTGLQSFLTLMNAAEKAKFEALYIERISQYYPKQQNQHILLPFRRIFMVSSK